MISVGTKLHKSAFTMSRQKGGPNADLSVVDTCRNDSNNARPSVVGGSCALTAKRRRRNPGRTRSPVGFFSFHISHSIGVAHPAAGGVGRVRNPLGPTTL